MNFVDSALLTPLQGIHDTPEGYLVADAFCVRTGIQDYLGVEVGKPEKHIVKIYRPESEVFSRDSIRTFAHKPVTVDHPPEGVTADTWKDKAVGEVSTDALRDGERLKLQLIVKDQKAIDLVKSGAKRELSAGYNCDIDWTAGVAPDGQAYDGVQRNIVINHLALVSKGRAGNCRIGDAATWGVTPINDEDTSMATKTMTFDGVPVEVTPAAEAIINRLNDKLTKMTEDHDAAVADVSKLKGENAVLTKQVADAAVTPEKLNKMVADRQALMGDFEKVTGKKPDVNLSDAELKSTAVKSVLGDAAKDFDDAAMGAAFATLVATKPQGGNAPVADAAPGAIRSFFADNVSTFPATTSSNLADSLKAEDAAWAKTLEDLNKKEV